MAEPAGFSIIPASCSINPALGKLTWFRKSGRTNEIVCQNLQRPSPRAMMRFKASVVCMVGLVFNENF